MSLSRGYSLVDRALHHVAFSLPVVQRTLGELESDLYRKQLDTVTSRNEVFVTGLPRAGTTLVLQLLYQTGEFASFTYREMPFILAPLMWRRLSASSERAGRLVERAHGDGVKVSYDSPEAFEEVAWLAHLGSSIERKHTLAAVPAEAVTEEAASALKSMARKLILAATRPDQAMSRRYLSKNNANISRLGAIARIFPTARVLVVFRDPLAQVASLMGQHKRFLAEHAKDRFSERYMRWIGHFEFGANHKPIDFDGRWGSNGAPGTVDAQFWMEYWTAAYRHVLEHRTAQVRLVDFDALRQAPRPGLERLARDAAVRDTDRLISAAPTLRAPTVRALDAGAVPADVLLAAQEVHQRLQAAAADSTGTTG